MHEFSIQAFVSKRAQHCWSLACLSRTQRLPNNRLDSGTSLNKRVRPTGWINRAKTSTHSRWRYCLGREMRLMIFMMGRRTFGGAITSSRSFIFSFSTVTQQLSNISQVTPGHLTYFHQSRRKDNPTFGKGIFISALEYTTVLATRSSAGEISVLWVVSDLLAHGSKSRIISCRDF